jgi:hypothetical protein
MVLMGQVKTVVQWNVHMFILGEINDAQVPMFEAHMIPKYPISMIKSTCFMD